MGSPTCLSCPFCLDTDFDLVGLKLHLTQGDCDEYVRTALPTRTGRPTPPATAVEREVCYCGDYMDAHSVAGSCLSPRAMPQPTADARPMVVGGAFVKFDRPAPDDDAVGEDDVRRCEGCNGVAVTTDPEDVPLCRPCAKACDEPTHPAPDAGAAEDHPSEAKRDHGAEGSDRAVGEAAMALCDYLDKTSGGEEWKGASLVRQLRAALRGTNQGDQPKAGHEAEGREGA